LLVDEVSKLPRQVEQWTVIHSLLSICGRHRIRCGCNNRSRLYLRCRTSGRQEQQLVLFCNAATIFLLCSLSSAWDLHLQIRYHLRPKSSQRKQVPKSQTKDMVHIAQRFSMPSLRYRDGELHGAPGPWNAMENGSAVVVLSLNYECPCFKTSMLKIQVPCNSHYPSLFLPLRRTRGGEMQETDSSIVLRNHRTTSMHLYNRRTTVTWWKLSRYRETRVFDREMSIRVTILEL
jgi:hypothetical protein